MEKPEAISDRDFVEGLPYIGEYFQSSDMVYRKDTMDAYIKYLLINTHKEKKMHEIDWPIGRLATKLILFTREINGNIEKTINAIHHNAITIDPSDNKELASKYGIASMPTLIFLYKESIIHRIDF